MRKMVSVKGLILCLICVSTLVAGCASTTLSDVEKQKETTAANGVGEWVDFDFERNLERLNIEPRFGAALRPEQDEVGYEAISFILARAFRGEVLIRLEYYPARTLSFGDEVETTPPFAALTIINRREKQIFDPAIKSVNHTQTRSDRYVRDFAEPVFYQIKNKMLGKGIRNVAVLQPPTGCFDGDRYYIALESKDDRKLITRHFCDEDFKSTSIIAQPLFEFAQDNVPDAVEFLSEAWREVSTAVTN
jgi:hypothetical protein